MEIKHRIIIWLISKMLGYNPFIEVEAASEYYADRKWMQKHSDVPRNQYPLEYCNIRFAWIDGYIKCLHDNGLRFNNGKIVKDIEKYSV